MATSSRLCCFFLVLLYITSTVCEDADQCAIDFVDAVKTDDLNRRLTGIDVSVTLIPDIIPELINGKNEDISHLVDPAMFYNFCKKCQSEGGLGSCHTSKSPDCPYKLSSPCPAVETMKYRRSDGSCNNVQHPLWGSGNIPFIRRLTPQYHDAFGEIRINGANGETLPNPRFISTSLETTSSPSTSPISSLYIGFGQMTAHDITNTHVSTGDLGYPLQCCKVEHSHKCSVITIPSNDVFYSAYNTTCMPFDRSAEATDLKCQNGIRQQMNQISSYLDGSTVYGDSDTHAQNLRVPGTGLLKMAMTNLFPVHTHPNLYARELGFSTFFGGDEKVNAGPQLFGSSLMFHRFHNVIAAELQALNTAWTGYRVYEESRRFVIATIQHITYNEWLPLTVSSELMTRYGLRPLTNGYFTGYDPSIDASLWNVVSTAAFRFGHTLINNEISYADRDFKLDSSKTLELKDMFFKPLTHVVREQDVLRGQMVTSSEICDRSFSESMQNHLYETETGKGLDVVAMNIHRGRDHGLPPYKDWRSTFQLTSPTNWTIESFPDHSEEDMLLFQQIYDSPSDIDIFPAAVSERPMENRTVGRLLGEILAAQFDRMKKGDRFWYETDAEPQRFELDQLGELRNMTLAKVMCAVSELDTIQEHPLLVYSTSNPRVPCSTFSYSLIPWEE